MDFGKILNQWDSRQANARRHARERHTQHDKVSHKKANAPHDGGFDTPPRQYTGRRHSTTGMVSNEQQRDKGAAIRAVEEKWIHTHLTYDKDAVADEEAAEEAERSVKYIKSMKPDARLDLHGLTQKEAWERLSNFIDDCMRRGARKVLIIHGKGIHSCPQGSGASSEATASFVPVAQVRAAKLAAADSEGVLSGVVRSFIEMDGRCGRSGHPDRKHGGSGATWVMLKR